MRKKILTNWTKAYIAAPETQVVSAASQVLKSNYTKNKQDHRQQNSQTRNNTPQEGKKQESKENTGKNCEEQNIATQAQQKQESKKSRINHREALRSKTSTKTRKTGEVIGKQSKNTSTRKHT